MAGQSDQQPPGTGITPVPDLIEQYRLRRDAWIAQADELARLRDEVRSSAEREAMEIVTTARRDVRKVIMEARRELLVLSAQVQAALGETAIKTDPNTLLSKAGITSEPGPLSLLSGSPTEIFAPEDAVNEILNEVHDDMTALAEDARVLPVQVVPPARQIATPSPLPSPTPQPAAPVPPRPPLTVVAPPASVVPPPETIPPIFSFPPEVDDFPALEESASKPVLSSPFPSNAVPVQSGRSISAFVALFVGIGVVVGGVTIWWLSNRNSGEGAAPEIASGATPSAAAQPPSEAESADTVSTSPVAPTELGDLSLVAEAVRNVWVRTTIDGRTDGGRTLMAGEVIDLSAERSISLRVGDAGAIVVSVNRGEKRPLGDDGEVLTEEFVVEGADVPSRAPAKPPAEAKPAPGAVRSPSPIASAAPALASPAVPAVPAPTTPFAGVGLNLPPPSPPSPAVPAPPPPSQLATNGSQPTVPSGIVNQLSAPAAASPNAAAPTASPATSPATVVVAIARQWLDAYHRQDRAAMSALSTENLLLADERRADERFPPGLNDVTRTLDRVSVQIAADTAVLTALMSEQSGSAAAPHVSPISQVWVLGGGQWKVRQARFVSEARLNQVFR